MKYRIFNAITIFTALLCVCVTVSASSYEYSITPSENFVSVKSGDDMSVIAKKLNMTTAEFNSYFNDNGLIYFAISDDTKSQIKISAFSDNFSSEVGDILRLDDAALNEFAKTISTDSENPAQVIQSNGRNFIYTTHTLDNNDNVYTITQYITICNNKTFYFTGYNSGENTSKEISDAFKSFTLSEQQDTNSWYSTLIIIGIVLFSALAVIMIIGIIRTYFKKEK